MMFYFLPELVPVATVQGLASIEEFGKEKSIFSANANMLYPEAGSLLARISDGLLSIPGERYNGPLFPTVDMRVQRLMPGMYPSIPGWHCDDVPRATYDSQPDLTKVRSDVRHYTCLLSTDMDVSNTEFVTEPFEAVFDPSSDLPIWKQLHRQVESRKPKTTKVTPGVIYRFNQTTIHRATPCVRRGWRIFFRLSLREKPPVEQPANQQQVYLLSDENGW